MKELTTKDVDAVTGGNAFVLGVLGGVAGSYIYDSLGGMEGINSGLSQMAGTITEFFSDAWENDPGLKFIRDL